MGFGAEELLDPLDLQAIAFLSNDMSMKIDP